MYKLFRNGSEAHEREQANPGGGIIVDKQVDITRVVSLAPERRTKQAEFSYRKLLEHLAVGEKRARHVGPIHVQILTETVPGVKTHCATPLPLPAPAALTEGPAPARQPPGARSRGRTRQGRDRGTVKEVVLYLCGYVTSVEGVSEYSQKSKDTTSSKVLPRSPDCEPTTGSWRKASGS